MKRRGRVFPRMTRKAKLPRKGEGAREERDRDETRKMEKKKHKKKLKNSS
jgi:hypothetical protein